MMASTLGVIGAIGAGPAGAEPTAIMTIVSIDLVTEDFSCVIVSIDLGTGSTSTLSSRDDEHCPIDYAPRADGAIYGVTLALNEPPTDEPSRLVTVDPATGAMTDVGSTGVVFDDIGGLEFDAAGNLWMAGSSIDPECELPICLWQVDPTSGAATFVDQLETPEATFSFLGGMTRTCVDPLYTNHGGIVDNAGETSATGDDTAEATESFSFYTPADVGAAQVGEGTLATLDTATPALDDIGPLGDTEFATGLAFANDGVLWAVVLDEFFAELRTYSTGTVDPATGQFTKVATLDVADTEEAAVTPTGLTFLPDPCAAPAPTPAPVVLEPTFTG
jgi:hypothetical protein